MRPSGLQKYAQICKETYCGGSVSVCSSGSAISRMRCGRALKQAASVYASLSLQNENVAILIAAGMTLTNHFAVGKL